MKHRRTGPCGAAVRSTCVPWEPRKHSPQSDSKAPGSGSATVTRPPCPVPRPPSSLTPAPAREPHLQQSNRNSTYRFFTSAMPRKAFLGTPRIWFSLRSLNKERRGTALALRLAFSASHYDNKTPWRLFGGLFSLRPQAATACILFLPRWPLLKWLQGEQLASRAGSVGGLTPPGHEPGLASLLHRQYPSLFCHLPETTPGPLPQGIPPPAGAIPPQPHISGTLPLSSGIGMGAWPS